MGKTGVIISINMKSTSGAERIYDVIASTDMENAMVGYLDGLVEGEDAVYQFVPGTKADAEHVIVDQPVWDYDECRRTNQRKDNFKIEAGTKFRVRKLAKADEFGINKAAVTADSVSKLAKNAYLTVDTTGKFVANDTSNASAVVEATIIRQKMQGANLVTNANTYGYSNEIYEVKVNTLA